MAFFRYILVVTIIGLFINYPVIVFCQQLSEEPAGGMEEETVEASTLLLPPSLGLMPSAIDVYPVNRFYKSWDTAYVRRYSDPVERVNDSVMLPLFAGYSDEFVFPYKGQLISPFGYRGRRIHSGVDIKLNLNDSVGAAFGGVVRMARYYHGYGNCVVVRHYNGLETLYGHLSKIKVKVNQEVKAGELLGLGGRSGRASCYHLHFETRFGGQAFNPKQLIDFENFSLIKDTLTITSRTFGRSRDYMPSTDNLIASTERNISLSDTGEKSAIKELKKSSSSAKISSRGKKYHTIKNGDTLSSISRKNGTTVKQLCSLNKIKPDKVLKLGVKLRVK